MPWKFQGMYYDTETELCYVRHRFYDPSSGTFISQDPIRLSGNNPTLYWYVSDSNSWVDEFGLNCGRAGKQAKLKSMLDDPNIPRHIKGWIKQELDSITRGNRKNIRNRKAMS